MVPMYESGENYLETILMIEKESKIVRAIDIARKLSVSKPSVSRAMGILRDAGFIDMAENGHGPILLTEKGREKASSIYRRHQVLTDFLQIVTGVDEVKAEENACRIEHVIDEEIFQGINSFVENHK